MENASKALLIAAALLIVIMLIAFGMRIFNSTSDTIQDTEKTGQGISESVGIAGGMLEDEFDKLEGKNLLNIPNSFIIRGCKTIYIDLPAGEYTLSIASRQSSSDGDSSLVLLYYDNGKYIWVNLRDTKKEATFKAEKAIKEIIIYSSGDYDSSQNVTTTFNKLKLTAVK